MNAYFDSGVLVKNYCLEPDSLDTALLTGAEEPPFPLTYLQETEVRNALRLKVFRKEITAVELKESLRLLDADIQSGHLERPLLNETAVYRRAESLSGLFTTTIGARTLDILHVAAALELGSTRFVSFDQRQRAVAKKVGLKLVSKP